MRLETPSVLLCHGGGALGGRAWKKDSAKRFEVSFDTAAVQHTCLVGESIPCEVAR